MDFDLSEDQRLLKDSVDRLVADQYQFEQRKKPEGKARSKHDAFHRNHSPVPLPRGAPARRQGLGCLADLLCSGRRVLDAVLDDDETLIDDPQTEISLIYYGHRAVWRIGVPHQNRAVERYQPAAAADVHNINNVEILSRPVACAGCASTG